MTKILRQNAGGIDFTVAGCSLTGSSDTAAADYEKIVTLSDGDVIEDGMTLVVTFENGNSAGNAPSAKTIYSSDQETYYEDEQLTIPFTLAPAGCYDIEYTGTGNAYSYVSYPVIVAGSVRGPVCDYRGKLTSGNLWQAGDKVQCMYKQGKFMLLGGSGNGSSIKIYNTFQELLEDLPNMSVGDVLATYDKKDIKTGVPLGTWASFANDSAPNGEWLQAGTTFNENTYPALAMMLGSNVVPEMFDHNRPGDWEDVASTNTFTPNYDGFMAVSYYNSGVIIKVNGVQIDIDNSPSNTNGNMTLPFKKGDVITFFNVYDGSARAIAFKVYYYKHPLFIKATPTSSDTDYEGTLNAIRNFTANAESYSTEEKWTGGYWIDGKPIYRRVFEYNGSISGSSTVTLTDLLPSANYVDTAICGWAIGLRDNNNLKKMTVSLDWWLLEPNTKTVIVQILSTMYCKQIILEYTKTTED